MSTAATAAFAPLRVEPDPKGFLSRAEDFAREVRGDAAFRFLRLFTRCTERELDLLAKKVYCDAMPESMARWDSLERQALAGLLHPFHYLLRKTWLWRRAPEALYDLETPDPDWFRRWFGRCYASLPAPKRITPRVTGSFAAWPLGAGEDVADSIHDVVHWRCVLLLFAAPLFVPYLYALSRRHGLAILAAYRRALGVYATFDGHFRRYPCRHFVTYSDENNHPCRHFAFRQSCPGEFVVVQNGERSVHPMYAFGSMDLYLGFGRYTERMCAELGIEVGRHGVVGAICLAERYPLAKELEASGLPQDRWDILFVDQSLPPYNGLDPRTGGSFYTIFSHLDRLKAAHPRLRIAYQLRVYAHDPAQKAAVLGELRRCFTQPVEVLENEGKGESYRNCFQSRLTMTFSSTLGYEAVFLGRGKKVLFVNFSGNPYEVYCDDPRYQIYDPSGDYPAFERHVLALLDLPASDVPEPVRERHGYFDDRAQERVAAALRSLDAGRS